MEYTPSQLREIDAAIVEHVYGRRVFRDVLWYGNHTTAEIIKIDPSREAHSGSRWDGPKCPLPRYSTDVAAAWEVVEKMRHRSPTIRTEGDGWFASLCASDNPCDLVDIWDGLDEHAPACRRVDATAPTMPLAVCLAALKAVGKPYANA